MNFWPKMVELFMLILHCNP